MPLAPLCVFAMTLAAATAQPDLSRFPTWAGIKSVPDCSDEAKTCNEKIHTKSWGCVELWRTEQPSCAEHTRELLRAWMDTSLEWHRVADECINATAAGLIEKEPATYEEILAQLADCPGAPTDTEPIAGESASPMSQELVDCWNEIAVDSAKCEAEILTNCKAVAPCLGYGHAPADQKLARWYNHVKMLRQKTGLGNVGTDVAGRLKCGL